MTRTGHTHYLQRQKDLERTTHNCNEVQTWHGSPLLLHLHRCPAACREAAAQRHSSLLLPHLCHHGLTPAASAPLPASAQDSVLLAQHRRLRRSMQLCTRASAAVVHMPAVSSRVHHRQPCQGLDAHDLIATHAHGAAWDLVLVTWDGHSVCSASWNPVPVTVAPKPLAAVAVVQSSTAAHSSLTSSAP